MSSADHRAEGASGSSFLPLFATNFLGVANDNYLKVLSSFVILNWIADARMRSVLIGVTAAMLVLPFILCSPLADRLTVIFPKRTIVRLAKLAELPIVLLAIVGMHFHSTPTVIVSIVLMGLQSSLYSPAKYALIRDIGGVDRISIGMGGMEGASFLGVLGGTVIASFMADHASPIAWYASMIALAVAGIVGSFFVNAQEERNRSVHSVNPVRFFMRARRMAGRYPALSSVIGSLCVFWGVAAMLQQGLLVYGRQVLGLDSTHTGMLLALAAVGIVVGQILAGLIDRRCPLLEWTPVTGFAAAALLAILYFAPLCPVAFALVLALLAFDLGFFKLPLDAEIQRIVVGTRLNMILAYFNQITFVYMFMSSVVYIAVSAVFGASAFILFIALALVGTVLSLGFGCRRVLEAAGEWCLGRRYAIKADALPVGCTMLVLPNHPALIDPLLVFATYRSRNLHPLVDSAYFTAGFVSKVLATVGAVKVPDLRARHTAADVATVRGLNGTILEALANGENVVVYPSGHIYTENRENIGTRQLAYNLCRELPEGVRVIGVRTTGLWGSIWSRKGRNRTPSFLLTLVRGLFLWVFVCPFKPRRQVSMHVEDLTDRVREWTRQTRLEFNSHLTDWYNQESAA